MINALTSVRFYLFLSIFLSHFSFIKKSQIGNFLFENFLYNGNFAVTFFFILSGFCIALGYSDKFQVLDFDKIKTFIMKRIIKIYPLYILTGFIGLIIAIVTKKVLWVKLCEFIFLYMTMIQSFLKNYSMFNSVAWFVSAIFLCYLLTPFVFYFLKKMAKVKSYLSIYLSIWIFLIIVSVLLSPPFLDIKFYSYFYHFPPIRFLQYFSGILVGIFYKDYLVKVDIFESKKHLKNFLDVVLIVFLVGLYLFSFKMKPYELIFTQVVYIPVFSFTILYLCNRTSSILNEFLNNKINIFLGSISMECYLIHQILIILSHKYLVRIFPIDSISNIFFIAIILLLGTIILSLIFKKLYSKVLEYFSQNTIRAD